jgi:hypothetical protein
MAQHYSDPRREDDAYSLPDIETFYADPNDAEPYESEDGEPLEAGWYWWSCFPGCLPDGEPNGPFETEEEALSDAREGLDLYDDEG